MVQPLTPPQLNVCPVAWQALRNPYLIAIETDTQKISFYELHQCVSHIGLQLINYSMQKADRLVCIASNSLASILLQLTCLRHGFIFCPINAKFSQTEIQQRLALLETPFIWNEGEGEENNLILDFQQGTLDNTCKDTISIDSLDVISIIFTSGSSGFPKAVMHNFSNHFYSALGSQKVIPLTHGDKNLLSLPIFHISGYATVMRTLLAGATLQLLSAKVSARQLLKVQTTHLSLVSSQLIQLLAEPNFHIHSLALKHLLLGGSAFSSDILEQTQMRGFNYHLSYGSTEMASQIATSTNNEALIPLPFRKIKIVNKEILITGKTRFVGYFRDQNIKHNNYFASSDLGELNGNILKIIGRKDRLFISGGENIQPEEIEKVLLTFQGVSQAFVLPIDDSIYGQRPIAFIKWNNSDQSTELKAFMDDKLISFKRPLHYLSFPETQGIKPNKKQLTVIALKLLLIN
jgi:o-succinylbenzoate---CoA ligase